MEEYKKLLAAHEKAASALLSTDPSDKEGLVRAKKAEKKAFRRLMAATANEK